MDHRIFKTPADASAHCAAEMISIINERASAGSDSFIALSGGKTPDLLFKNILENFKDSVNWSKVHFFWVDERCVPPASHDSNYGVAAHILFSKIQIPASNIHRIIGEAEPESEAQRYAGEIRDLLPLKNGWPVFDLILLGMGDDGHTASVFPGNLGLLKSSELCCTSSHPQTGQTRITLTGKVLNNASEVRFLVTGVKKASVIMEIFNKEGNWLNYPASYIVPENGKLLWYLDEEAAGLLK